MTEKQEVKQRVERESAWRLFLSHISPRPEDTEMRPDSWREDRTGVREPHEPDIVHCVIATLLPSHPCTTSQSQDLDAVHRSLSFFRDAAQRGIITNDEALAVMRLVIARFVQRRFDCILWNILGDEPTNECMFRKVAPRLRHEQGYEPTR